MSEIEGQIAIEVPESKPTSKDCARCGKPATKEFELTPRKSVTRGGQKVWINPRTTPTCSACFDRLSDQPGPSEPGTGAIKIV